jgi:hypothetical protein
MSSNNTISHEIADILRDEVAIASPQSVISLHDLMPAAALCARHCRNWSS